MQLRTLGTFAASFGLWLGSTPAAEPGLLSSIFSKTEKAKPADDKSADKKLTDAIAAKFKTSDVAAKADIECIASNGAVTVKGSVGSEEQKKAILEIVRFVEGVKLVKDGLLVKEEKVVKTAKPNPKFVVQTQAVAPTIVPPATLAVPSEPAKLPIPEVVTKAAPTPIPEIVTKVQDAPKLDLEPKPTPAPVPEVVAKPAPAPIPEVVTKVQDAPKPVDKKVSNQKLADAVAAKLQGSEAASNADIEFFANSGTVTVSGKVGSESQKQAIIEIVRRVAGVKMVKDGVQVMGAEQAKMPMPETVVKAQSMVAVDNKVDNQKLADTIYMKLRGSEASMNADLDLFANNGAVIVAGSVGSEMQKRAIIEIVRRVDGVKVVRDGVQVKAMAPRAVPQMQTIMPAQAYGPLATQVPSAMPPMGMPTGNPQIAEAYPVGPGGGLDGAAPPLPQNAWPTYAPYNNVSRVAYPTAYPYNAFPFIGPYYPFPKVPLGWRKVTLEWEDGHWWLGRKQAPIDYWHVKFGY